MSNERALLWLIFAWGLFAYGMLAWLSYASTAWH
jgi:hypothetical protein